MSENGQSVATSSELAILLVDDNLGVARALEIAFRIAGCRLVAAAGPQEALSHLANERFDAILLDLNFTAGRSDGSEGLDLLTRIIADDPAACVVVVTAHSGIRIAVAAMKAGARDFAMKPWRNAELIAKVQAAIERGSPQPAFAQAHKGAALDPVRLLGESPAMQRLRALVRHVAPTSAGVIVMGPSGSGRTLTALAIHAASRESRCEPVRIDLRDDTAWPRLVQEDSTMILRYPDQLDVVRQERLLDRLPRTVRTVAIADSTASLVPALRRRIATVEIEVPPLSRREGDAVLLARHFARTAAERFGRVGMQLTAGAEAVIRASHWPDEVRGLAFAVERAVLLAEGSAIDAAALVLPSATLPVTTAEDSFDLTEAEKAMIDAALRQHRHNVSQAAVALGLSRGALYRRMARYGL